MDVKSEINFEIRKENVKFKITHRERGRMKIQIKFASDEAEALKNFYLAVNTLESDKFNELKFTEFCKSALFLGISTIQNNIMAKMQESLASNPEAKEEFDRKMEELNADLESQIKQKESESQQPIEQNTENATQPS